MSGVGENVHEDVAEIKRAVSRLSEGRLGLVLHRDYRLLHVSEDLVTVLGFGGPVPMGENALDLLDELARPAVAADGQRCMAGESVALRRVALRRSIGSALPAFLTQERVKLQDGWATAWLIALGLELAASMQGADAMLQMQSDLRLTRAALEAVPVGFSLTTGDFVHALRNRLFETYSGFPAETLDRFKTMDDQLRFQIERGDAAKQWLDDTRFTAEQIDATPSLATILRCQRERGRDGEITEEEILARLDWAKLIYGPEARADGVHWSIPGEFTRGDTGQTVELRNSPVPGIGWVQVLTDVTARRRAEDELRAANRKLEATVTELRAAQAQLILQEKMATLGQLTAGIAHEIKNPLNFINNFASLTGELIAELGEQIGPQKSPAVEETLAMIAKNMQIIGQHGKRTDSIVRTMLLHSRSGTAEWEQTDIMALVQDACNLGMHGARSNYPSLPINLVRLLPEEPVVASIVPQDIMRVLLNLLSNAFYAMAKRAKEGGEEGYRPQLSVALKKLAGKLEIVIRDNGIGITEDVRAKLFTPFFTTKAPGEGTGLGLSLSYDVVVHGHGGGLRVDSEPMSHTEFVITLPRRSKILAASAGLGATAVSNERRPF